MVDLIRLRFGTRVAEPESSFSWQETEPNFSGRIRLSLKLKYLWKFKTHISLSRITPLVNNKGSESFENCNDHECSKVEAILG